MNKLSTPAILVDIDRLDANIRAMANLCSQSGTRLWPHIKTHKSVEIARRQLAAGAEGLTCAKLGEAEAMLPSGVRRIFIAHSLVDPEAASRVAALRQSLDELILAVTSPAHWEAFENVAAISGGKIGVYLAIDTGMGREGVRTPAEAARLAADIARSPHCELRGIYTHEGHFYAVRPVEKVTQIDRFHKRLLEFRDAIDPTLSLWPGCSVTAALLAGRPGITGVRPGAYVFGDLALTEITRSQSPASVALSILATVVDKPEPGLALIDAGTKAFSGDKTANGVMARADDPRDLAVVRCNEEHGYVEGPDVDRVRVGERIRFIPAHVCTVVNLTDRLAIIRAGTAVDNWPVDARGKGT